MRNFVIKNKFFLLKRINQNIEIINIERLIYKLIYNTYTGYEVCDEESDEECGEEDDLPILIKFLGEIISSKYPDTQIINDKVIIAIINNEIRLDYGFNRQLRNLINDYDTSYQRELDRIHLLTRPIPFNYWSKDNGKFKLELHPNHHTVKVGGRIKTKKKIRKRKKKLSKYNR